MSHPTGSPARRRVRARRAGVGLVAALALGLLSACGGDDGGDTGAAPGTTAAGPTTAAETPTGGSAPTSDTAAPEASAQTITATEGEMFIRLSEESISAGSVTFEVVNEGSFPHDLKVEQDGQDVAGTDIVQPGGTTTLTVDLQAGEYVLYCSVGNHREMGMELPVTVS